MKIAVNVTEQFLGDVMSDLNTRRGRVEGMDSAPGGFQIIRAKAPLAERAAGRRNKIGTVLIARVDPQADQAQ